MRRMVNLMTSIAIVATCNVVAARGLADGDVAVGSMAQVVVIERSSGAELVPHFYHGEYWVAGRPGTAYSIFIRNRLGERILAVAAVDGVNVISGATAAWDQAGYVFDPHQRYEITGWRKSDSEVAAFTFTESSDSYAERTGRPAHVGVIGLALFRERQPEPVYVRPDPAEIAPPAEPDEAPAANGTGAAASAPSRSSQSLMRPHAPPLEARAPKLGTGHGEREFSYVNHTEFARLQSEPNEVIRIRYDSYDNLVAMGVIARPHPARPPINPFPDSPGQQYVPDPPGTNAGAR